MGRGALYRRKSKSFLTNQKLSLTISVESFVVMVPKHCLKGFFFNQTVKDYQL